MKPLLATLHGVQSVGIYSIYSTGTEVSFVRTLRTVYTGSVLKFEGKACSGPPSFVHSILLLQF